MFDGIANNLARYADPMKDAYCHGCGETRDVHVFHLADQRVQSVHTGAGTLVVQLCERCNKDSRGTEKGLLINVALLERSSTGEDIPPFALN